MFSFDLSMKKIVVDFVVSAGVGGSLVERHLEDLRQVRDACMGEDSPKERLRLRLRELGLPLNGRRSDDISLRKLSQAMGINLQHENGNRKVKDELVEALVSALLSASSLAEDLKFATNLLMIQGGTGGIEISDSR